MVKQKLFAPKYLFTKYHLLRGRIRQHVNRLRHTMLKHSQNPFVAYPVALLLAICATGIMYTIPMFPDASIAFLLLFLPLVAISSYFGGFFPSMLTAISIIGSRSYFLYQEFRDPLHIPQAIEIQIVVFFFEALFIGYLITRARRFDRLREFITREQHANNEMFLMKKGLEKARNEIRARDEFLSIVSHELKTPLTSMLLQSQSAIHNIRNVSLANFSIEKLLKMLDNAESQTKQLAKMVNDLMNVSLITTGKLDLEKEKVDLSQIVKNVVSQHEEKAKMEGSKVSIKTIDGLLGAWDKLRIEQVVTNLVTNAIKYGNGKPIIIYTQKKNGAAILRVQDNGIGIPKELQKRIFQRFERGVHDSKYEGLGVGLYITQQIVKAHNGKIFVESKENRGTTFTVELPLKG